MPISSAVEKYLSSSAAANGRNVIYREIDQQSVQSASLGMYAHLSSAVRESFTMNLRYMADTGVRP